MGVGVKAYFLDREEGRAMYNRRNDFTKVYCGKPSSLIGVTSRIMGT